MRKISLLGAVAVVCGFAALVYAQGDVKPTNSLPNPYETVSGWAKLPEGRTWGSTSAVEIDRDGKTIWVAERCGTNSCGDSMLDPILHFDASGKLIKSFGAGMITAPHGIFIDRDDNVWVTDCTCTGGGGRGAAAAPAPPPVHVQSVTQTLSSRATKIPCGAISIPAPKLLISFPVSSK